MKSNIVNTIIAQVIAMSAAACAPAARVGLASKHPKIQAIFDNDTQPFGCYTDKVAAVIEELSGVSPARRGAASTVQKLQVVTVGGAKENPIFGLYAIVLTDGGGGVVSVWTPTAPTDTWSASVMHLKPVSKAEAKPFWAAIKANKAAFLNVAKNHLSLGGLGLI